MKILEPKKTDAVTSVEKRQEERKKEKDAQLRKELPRIERIPKAME
jgi:hypothetical protein